MADIKTGTRKDRRRERPMKKQDSKGTSEAKAGLASGHQRGGHGGGRNGVKPPEKGRVGTPNSYSQKRADHRYAEQNSVFSA